MYLCAGEVTSNGGSRRPPGGTRSSSPPWTSWSEDGQGIVDERGGGDSGERNGYKTDGVKQDRCSSGGMSPPARPPILVARRGNVIETTIDRHFAHRGAKGESTEKHTRQRESTFQYIRPSRRSVLKSGARRGQLTTAAAKSARRSEEERGTRPTCVCGDDLSRKGSGVNQPCR